MPDNTVDIEISFPQRPVETHRGAVVIGQFTGPYPGCDFVVDVLQMNVPHPVAGEFRDLDRIRTGETEVSGVHANPDG